MKMAQVTRYRVLFIFYVHIFCYKCIFIYISFTFTEIKCNFRGCLDISRAKGSVDPLASFKGCCRSNQQFVSSWCAPRPRRLSASTWPVTPGSHHPHWNDGDHAKGRTSPLTRGLHNSVTSEPFEDEDALLTNMFLNAVGKGMSSESLMAAARSILILTSKAFQFKWPQGGNFGNCFTTMCHGKPIFPLLMSVGSLLSSDPSRSDNLSQIPTSFRTLCLQPISVSSTLLIKVLTCPCQNSF